MVNENLFKQTEYAQNWKPKVIYIGSLVRRKAWTNLW